MVNPTNEKGNDMTKHKKALAAIDIQDAIREDGELFVERLKLFAKDGVVKEIRLKDLTYNFEHGKAFRRLTSHYMDKVPQPHTCAAIEGLIDFTREGNKPYTYEILPAQAQRLRSYQQHTIDKIRNSRSKTILVAMATGSGKTYTALNLIKQYKTSMFVTPRINLSHQTKEVFGKEIDSIGILQGSNSDNVNADHIVANLQTLETRIKQGKIDTERFELVIFDECHFSANRILELHKHFPKAKIVGLTATPYTGNGTPLEGYDEKIDDFNAPYFIERGYLSPLRAMQTLTVDDTKLKKSANGDFTQQSIDDVTLDEILNSNIIKMTAAYIKPDDKVLVFAASIRHAELLTSGYLESGFTAKVIHSEIKDSLQIIKEFREEKTIQILVSVLMIGFGTDLPSVNIGIVARPMRSKSMWVQTVGRILRTAPSKKYALLLDCGGNLKRLGNPLAKVTPPKAKEAKKDTHCRSCGYKKQPYLCETRREDFIKINTYRCSSCREEHKVASDLETIACLKCGTYHLEDEAVISQGKEIIECECGETVIVRELKTFKMVVGENDYTANLYLLAKTSGEYLTQSIKDGNFAAAAGGIERLETYINHDEEKIPKVLDIIDSVGVASAIQMLDRFLQDQPESNQPEQQSSHQEIQGSHKEAPQPQFDINLGDVVNSLDVDIEFKEKLADRISQSSMQHNLLSRSVTTRLRNLDREHKDINSIFGFITWVENQES